ncbi:hypothetical protein BX661DRAFT_175595 [Kickxella alabastrina]|uniref:uncharacterized protein n=1 Tax=Kickxella alabastrina TaxID=61397 RepID=UPI00221F7D99|nr:uncharacterized protein BX661DRAFT_175595 [Kickxella alabastrina]KAI7834822.1 hypothetical protein BX661DRAFT_175595 [Kickxella alabastrina]
MSLKREHREGDDHKKGNNNNKGSMNQFMPSRPHKRIAMSPIGLPLNDLKTIKELIVVCADAMHAHHTIAKT